MWLVWIFSFQAVWTDRFPDRLYSSETWPLKGADVFTSWCPFYSFGMKLKKFTLIFHRKNLGIAKEHALQKLTAKEVCFFSALFCPSFSATTLHTSSKLRCCRCRLLAWSQWHHSQHCRLLCDILGRLDHVSIQNNTAPPSITHTENVTRPPGGWKSCNAWARRLCRAKNCTLNRKIFNYFEKELWTFSTFVCGSKLFHVLVECPCDFVGQVAVTSSEMSVATTLQEFPSPYSSEAVWKSFFIRWVRWAFWKSCSSSWFTRDTLRCSTVPGIILGLGAVWRSISMPSM